MRIGATWNRSIRGTGFGVDGPQERRVQLLGRDALEQVGHEARRTARRARRARGKERSASSAKPREDRGDVLERLALEQPGEQQVALLPQRQLVVEVDVVATGQQPPRLQLDERRRDQQELGGEVEIEALQPLDLVR